MEPRPEKVLPKAVLVFLVRGSEVLLALKPKRNTGEEKIGEGRRNGYGGGVEPGETLIQAAIRETKEEGETDIEEISLTKVAIATFHNKKDDGSTFTCEVHVYVARNWFGDPRSTAEMTDPRWYPLSQLPAAEMMPADSRWVSNVIRGGGMYRVEAFYKNRQRELENKGEVTIVPVDSLPD